MRAKIVSCEAQPDNQALVTKNLLFIAKNGVGKLWMKARKRLGLFLTGLHNGDVHGVIRIAGPYEGIPISLAVIWELAGRFGNRDIQSS